MVIGPIARGPEKASAADDASPFSAALYSDRVSGYRRCADSTSKADITADGFVRLSWNEDGWATDADGLKKPGSPAYKTNLVAGHPFGALVGRVGAKGDVFFIGKRAAKTGLPAGRLGSQ